MGGDHLHSFASEDESSTLDYEDYCSEISSVPCSFYRVRDEDGTGSESSGFLYKGFDDLGFENCSNPVDFDNTLRRRKIAYNEIMRNYADLWAKRDSLYQAKSKILSYTPGSWISNAGDKKLKNYAIPEATTLLLIGPKGSGKSSLINRISRVFEHDNFASERAQVTYNSSSGEGTFFLQEYMIPRGFSSFCLFDSRSLSEVFVDNDEMLQHWMTKGVRHGELVTRDSDSPSLKISLQCKARQSSTISSEIRKVNFVIFVVNGLSVLRSMNSDKEEDKRYMETVIKTFSCPYLSYKDDKPVIVVTHGDLLSLRDRARVRVYLGEKLGVPPAKQIFDIPDKSDPLTELTILDMIRYSLEHADKHMPCRESREWVDSAKFSVNRVKHEVSSTSILTFMFMAILLGIACVAFPVHQSQKNTYMESARSWPSKATMDYPYQPHEHHAEFPSDSEPKYPVNYSQNRGHHMERKPEVTSPRTLTSKASVHSQGHENREPKSTPVQSKNAQLMENEEKENTEVGHENGKSQVTTATASSSDFVIENNDKEYRGGEQENWEHETKPAQTLPLKSSVTEAKPEEAVVTSAPAPRLSFATDCQQKQPGSQSRSPEKRHPKAAVKWHKIRHLWLDQ